MKIYVASSWKNQHGVEMLTKELRDKGHTVDSWVENCDREGFSGFKFEDWINTPEADDCFIFDVAGAMNSDICIYYGPAGKDACCEVGAAYATGSLVLGLLAKGEDIGLMRKMVSRWHTNYRSLLNDIENYTILAKNKKQ